jgi:Kef-type K+ transport system membrane component KefB
MIPRGEVGMIVAQIGLGFGILSRSSYAVVVFMSVATTIAAPPLIKIAYGKSLQLRRNEAEEEILRMG